MRLMFFSEHCKFNADSKIEKKNPEKIYGFLDNFIWVGNGKFSLLLREYSFLAVNLLTNSAEISDLIENNSS